MRALSYRAAVPAWFVSVGLVATWLPAPTVAIGLLALAVTVVVIPSLVLMSPFERWRRRRSA